MSGLDPQVVALLSGWMPGRRWYPAKGRGVTLRHLGTRTLSAPGAETEVLVHVVGLDSGDRVDVVQVPLTYRDAPLAEAEPGLLGRVEGPADHRWVYDAPHDPAYVTTLLAALQRPAGRAAPRPVSSRVLTGEQSNTSVIVQTETDPVIVKVFRTLHPGANPDVEVLGALDGSTQVPALVGWLDGTWHGTQGTEVTGHLAVAAEFVADGRDAWREAIEAVDAGRDFTTEAFGLGAATARLHGAMADAFGSVAAGPSAQREATAALRDRVAWALGATDALDHYRAALVDYADGLTLTDVPALQRVHGDYHLGQVLHSPSRGWVVLDFEGEPLRALAERTEPDLALRDVAGMLRSFDYAAGQVQVTEHDPVRSHAAHAWADAARDAFCRGYASVAGADPRTRGDLLGALELDKALYEVVYEARNRPGWIDVPLSAIVRLLGVVRD